MGNAEKGQPPVPLLRGTEVIEAPARQETLTRRYTDEAIRFVRERKGLPFFLYVAYTFPHVPLHASDGFRGKSARGLYGDVVEELDASVGSILGALRELGLAEHTLVFFTSDNGPWLTQGEHGGSAGLLREGKGSTWEGGMRVPGIAWWPGKVRAGQTTGALATTMDLFTTFGRLAGAGLPADRPIDGVDVSSVLLRGDGGPREVFFYYRDDSVFAVRKGPWKAHFLTQPGYGTDTAVRHDPPLLFHLDRDPSERQDVAEGHPEVIREILAELERHQLGIEPVASRIESRVVRL
jgi:arylsulfatase A-like enzyme